MAQGKTGIFYASGDNIQIRFYYSESYDIVSNTSTITISKSEFKTAIQRGNYQFSGNLKIDGVVLASFNNLFQFVSSADNATWFKMDMLDGTPFPWTLRVNHSNDGTKSIHLTADIALSIYGKWGNYSRAISGNDWIRLTDIPRASNVSASNADISRNCSIVISKYVDSYKHTLTYNFGNLNGTIATKTSANTVNWTIPASFYNQIPNDKSGTGTITCITYYGDTELGRKSCSFRATAAYDLCKPTLNPAVNDINPTTTALTGNSNNFIRYFSNAQVNSGASARNGARIVSQSVTCGSKSLSAGSGTLEGVDSGSFEFLVTDSRGYSTSLTTTKTLVEYVYLTSNLVADRPTTDGVMNLGINGNYFSGNFGASVNSLVIQYRYKANDEPYGAWYTAEATADPKQSTYRASATVTGLNYLNAYTVQARAYDKLLDIYSAEIKVKTQPIFDWSETDFNFNVPVKMPSLNIDKFNGLQHMDQLALGKDKWFGENGDYALHLNNSDIIGVNGVYMADACNNSTEGILYPTTGGDWDNLRSYDGQLIYQPNIKNGGKANTVLHTGIAPDYVVAQGISGSWYYRKWNNGFAECWGSFANGDMNFNRSWGNLVVSDVLPAQSYPFTFAWTPYEYAVLGNNGGSSCMVVNNSDNTTKQTRTYTLVRPGNNGYNIAGSRLNYLVVGKWK